jgi:uncharacterized membrane protein
MHKMMRFALAMLAVARIAIVSSHAEEHEFEASKYYCEKLNGSAAGDRQCRAEYQAYPGDACSVYDSAGEKDPRHDSIIQETGSQCTSAQLDDAKTQTLAKRADLMGYVSLGNDETINDPVRNTSMRPGNATYWTQMTYFANECAIQKCGGSARGGGNASAPPPAPEDDASNACKYENDGTCDAPGLCPAGTDRNDCQVAEQPKKTPKPQTSRFFDLKVCNNHDHKVYFALGSRRTLSDTYFTFQGWWSVDPGECVAMGSHVKGYFYIHGYDAEGHKWGKEKRFCVRSQAFRYLRDGSGACSQRSENFFESFTNDDEMKFSFGK